MQITKFIPAPREVVFSAFTDPGKLEKWCYPEGFTLTIPKYEARGGGNYRYLHQGPDGLYNCVGHFQEFILDERLAFTESVTDPHGKVIFDNLTGSVSFRDRAQGTDITITQEGFKNEEDAQMCEEGLVFSLTNLTNYLAQVPIEGAAAEKANRPSV